MAVQNTRSVYSGKQGLIGGPTDKHMAQSTNEFIFKVDYEFQQCPGFQHVDDPAMMLLIVRGGIPSIRWSADAALGSGTDIPRFAAPTSTPRRTKNASSALRYAIGKD
jgi:hypothetical protein